MFRCPLWRCLPAVCLVALCLASCGNQTPKPRGAASPEALLAQLEAAIEAKDRDAWLRCFVGQPTSIEVFAAIYDVRIKVDQLSALLDEKYGDGSLVYEDGAVSTDDLLPGIHRDPTIAPPVIQQTGQDAAAVRTDYLETDLILRKSGDRWCVDADESLDQRGGSVAQYAALYLNHYTDCLAALDHAIDAARTSDLPREKLLDDFRKQVLAATIAKFRESQKLKKARRGAAD